MEALDGAARRRTQDRQRRARARARRAGLAGRSSRAARRESASASSDPTIPWSSSGCSTSALPPERWTRASDTLILHGRRICRPQPLCDRCAARSSCAYFRALGAKKRHQGPAPSRRNVREGGASDAHEVPRARRRSARRHPGALPRRDAEHRDRRRRRADRRAARRGRHRAAGHAARPVPGHAAHRAAVGARQRAARQDHALPGPDRRRRATTRTTWSSRSARR